VVSAHHDDTAEAIAAAILQSLNANSDHVALEDDVTLVVLKAEARTIEREFDSSWEALDAVTALVHTNTAAYGSDLTDRLELATSELVTNILKHAYKNGRGKVNVSLALTHTHITLLLCDQGIHFNPDDIPEPSFGELVEGGYGLYIVRQLVEDTTYTRKGDWNVWRLHVPVD
jgi:anti-sigma regulatory factor (Ser/Thr protein kinase)